ncbi:MAG: hypothetical protein IT355_08570 [Gemmatimonadaceae bacterium]|nr:hypothetical protein [Gemmatimonadaceae bacterium]
MSVFQSVGAGGTPDRHSAIHIARAEELLGTLPGVVSVRIEASPAGDVDAIHVLTSVEIGPKQTVRNIESALLAHLGMRVDHRKISVATTVDAPRIRLTPSAVDAIAGPAAAAPAAVPLVGVLPGPSLSASTAVPTPGSVPAVLRAVDGGLEQATGARRYVFDDVEVKRSRNGLACRVTLRRGEESFEGESEGVETDAARLELAARATVLAIAFAEGRSGAFSLAGAQRVDAFGTEFVFVGVSARQGRESVLLSGSCAIRDSAEVAGSLAVLDATNRWLEATR